MSNPHFGNSIPLRDTTRLQETPMLLPGIPLQVHLSRIQLTLSFSDFSSMTPDFHHQIWGWLKPRMPVTTLSGAVLPDHPRSPHRLPNAQVLLAVTRSRLKDAVTSLTEKTIRGTTAFRERALVLTAMSPQTSTGQSHCVPANVRKRAAKLS